MMMFGVQWRNRDTRAPWNSVRLAIFPPDNAKTRLFKTSEGHHEGL